MQAFGDGFDLYAAVPDMYAGYWDTGGGTTTTVISTGRFSGSQALGNAAVTSGLLLSKSSGANDAVHHIVCAFYQTPSLSGTVQGLYFQFNDAGTNQCCVIFRSDGAMLLRSGGPAGTVLDTYASAFLSSTWTAYEVEVVINNTTGSWTIRKNGNTGTPDHALGSLNTRGGTANNYANQLVLQTNSTSSPLNSAGGHRVDDFLWRSDPSSVPWVGDIRCYTRMPASDVQDQFTRLSPITVTPFGTNTTLAFTANQSRYGAFTATFTGTVGTVNVTVSAGYTGNLKGAIFASAAGQPGAVLGSATPLANPVAGSNTLTFSTPVSVTRGTQYVFGYCGDTSAGTQSVAAASTGYSTNSTSYSTFPVSSPGTAVSNAPVFSVLITTGVNAEMVSEAQEDGATSYVFDSNVGDADFYNIAAIGGTPSSTVCCTTRGYFEKSDAGTRSAAVQLKSGTTTVTSTSTALATSWGWLWRTDLNDPNTGTAWTTTAVNNAQVGPTVTA